MYRTCHLTPVATQRGLQTRRAVGRVRRRGIGRTLTSDEFTDETLLLQCEYPMLRRIVRVMPHYAACVKCGSSVRCCLTRRPTSVSRLRDFSKTSSGAIENKHFSFPKASNPVEQARRIGTPPPLQMC